MEEGEGALVRGVGGDGGSHLEDEYFRIGVVDDEDFAIEDCDPRDGKRISLDRSDEGGERKDGGIV